MASRKLQVEIIGDSSSLERAFGKSSKAGSNFGSTLGTIGKTAAFAAGAAGIGAIAVTLKAGISEFSQSTKVAAQTEAVLKSTGASANVTAKQIDDLAGAIMAKSGIDDEAIASGENMLLTFTNIRNEVGKGNDIFTQSTSILADMSVALGTDMSKQAIQLGKALNDPIKGVSALARVGVTFTEGQKKTIKGLVDSGRAMDAQKLILGELNKEFGGSAKAVGDTLPGKINILKESFSNLAGDLVGKAVPAVTTFVGFLTDKGLPALTNVLGAIGDKVGPAIEKLSGAFKSALPGIMAVIQPLVEAVRDNLLPIWNQLADVAGRAITAIGAVLQANGPQIQQIFENLGQVISNLGKIVIPILEFAFTKVLPVALKIVIPVLVLLTGALVKVSDVIRIVANVITSFANSAIPVIASFAAKAVAAFTSVRNFIQQFGPVWTALSKIIGVAIQAITGYVTGVVTVIRGVINIVVGLLTGDWQRAWNGLKTAVQGAVTAVKAILTGLPAVMAAIAVQIGAAIIRGIADGFGGLLGWLKSRLESGLKSVVTSLNPFSPVEEGGAKYIGRPLAEGAVRGWIEGSAALPKAMTKGIQDAVEAARTAITSSEGVFASAFDSLASNALSAFDKISSEFETRTERAIRKQDEARAAAERQSALTTAQTGLATATAGGDPEAIKAAQQALDDALFAIQRANQEKRAEQERIEYEQKRERQRVNLTKRLQALQQAYANEELTTQQFHSRLIGIFKAFEIPMGKAAKKLGFALADGLNASFTQVERAARNLAQTIVDRLSEITVKVHVELQDIAGGQGPAGKAAGGPVRRGTPYIVGEVGPELFIPKSSGTIISNAQASSGGTGVGGDIILNFNGPTVGTSRDFEDAVRRALYDVSRRNPGSGLVTA